METPANQDARFTGSKLVRVAPSAVYDFVSRVENLPTYLAMATDAREIGNDRMHIEVDLGGRQHGDEGLFRRVPDDQRIEWGSEAGDYEGSIEVEDEDGNARVTMHLRWAAESPFPEQMGGPVEGPDSVNDAIEATLESIKNILEGTGGAIHPDDAEA